MNRKELQMEKAIGWWWLSFADNDCFRGACVVQGDSFILAVGEAHRLGISPGGQVFGVGPMTEEEVLDEGIPLNTLLRKEDIPDPVPLSTLDTGELREGTEEWCFVQEET